MQEKTFRYLVVTENIGARRSYGLVVARHSSAAKPLAVAHTITRCRVCAQQLCDTLERHRVYPEHARDVVRDLMWAAHKPHR